MYHNLIYSELIQIKEISIYTLTIRQVICVFFWGLYSFVLGREHVIVPGIQSSIQGLTGGGEVKFTMKTLKQGQG